jgi:hypothetical protein
MTLPDVLPTPTKMDGPPDWETLREEVCCPLCEYNLRGLIEPRCPECGYRFSWRELLDQHGRVHPFLFEHHPKRNIVSFAHTLLAGWMPRRFWRTLTARHEINRRRLRWYAILLMIMPFGLSGAYLIGEVTINTAKINALDRIAAARAVASGKTWGVYKFADGEYWGRFGAPNNGHNGWQRTDPPWPSLDFLEQVVSNMHPPWIMVSPVLVLLVWPWVTLATLMIFSKSMRVANVKRAHVIRCVVYAFDCIAVAAVGALWWQPSLRMTVWSEGFNLSLTAMLIVLPIGWYRLGSAYSQYLRFDRPYATALASQVITFLLITATIVYLV